MRLVHDDPIPPLTIPTIIGSSPAMRRVLALAARVAEGRSKVLITGESGVGKDVVARFIHSRSPRAAEPFVAFNCASLSETLLESELFGHVKGSFTGAFRNKVGKLPLAHRGTVFLDEIGEMSLRMQALLLRFLENGEVQPVGSDGPSFRVDVRVLSATNRDLSELVERGEFREDLLYRIKVAHVHVPPLRERRDDIRPLVEYVLAHGGAPLSITEDAMAMLEQYDWPGNVRELQNVVEQLSLVAARDSRIGVDELPAAVLRSRARHSYEKRERRRRVSDDLYDELVTGRYGFWDDIYTLFTRRDITRADLRQLVRLGLAAGGSYRGMLGLFGMDQRDYKKLMNFLAAHECRVDYREFRREKVEPPSRSVRTTTAAAAAEARSTA
jgi:transcriptional regulator with PAS, ATPase and Fis domain